MWRDDSVTPSERLKDYFQKGISFEERFWSFCKRLALPISRSDNKRYDSPDYKVELLVDVKYRHIPLHKAQKIVGLSPAECVVIDVPKIKSYIATKQNVMIFFEIDYRPKYDTYGQYFISVLQIQKLMGRFPQRIKTFYDYEKKKDMERFYISISEMKPVADMFRI